MKRLITPLFVVGLALAGQAHAAFVAVCDRTPQVRDFIVTTMKKECALITESDLYSLKRVAVPNRKIAYFKDGDFSGMPNLEILNIKGNPFTELPKGLTAELPNLKTLVLFRTKLTSLPDDFLAGNSKMENLHVFDNKALTTISETVFQRIKAIETWKILDMPATLLPAEQARLREIFPLNGKIELNFY